MTNTLPEEKKRGRIIAPVPSVNLALFASQAKDVRNRFQRFQIFVINFMA